MTESATGDRDRSRGERPAPGAPGSIAEISEIILAPPANVLRGLIYGLAGLTLVAFLWAYLSHYDVIVDAPGQLASSQPPGVIQAAAMGRVARVLAAEGERVAAGEPVIELTPTQAPPALGDVRSPDSGAGSVPAPGSPPPGSARPAPIPVPARPPGEILRAPVAGVVMGTAGLRPGTVVSPGQQLAEVAPEGGELFARVTIPNQDMGSVSGAKDPEVRIKIDAFPYQQYGALQGQLAWISPMPASPPGGGGPGGLPPGALAGAPFGHGPPGYEATITLNPEDPVTRNLKPRLRPGLSLTAEIVVGRRRLLSMLFSR